MTNSHGYILEYPRIRVDHFDQRPIPLPTSILAHRRAVLEEGRDDGVYTADQRHFQKPLLYLLTHIHTDHLGGLDRPGIAAPIYCSFATKNLLLRYERQRDRIGHDNDGGGLVRPYAHLQVSREQARAASRLSGATTAPHDLLHPLPYNQPTQVPYTPGTTLTLTLLESNHMFGGTMFLVEGPRGAVLHTGDLRAEGWWCEALVRNAAISRYIAWDRSFGQQPQPTTDAPRGDRGWPEALRTKAGANAATVPTSRNANFASSPDDESSGEQDTQDIVELTDRATAGQSLRLENIYLDTEMLLSTAPVPSKEFALQGLVALLRTYPADTRFFLNAWTWGYEGMLKAVAKAFGCRIHVDRFKAGMYKAARCEDPFLSQIITLDPEESRFHACESKDMCQALLRGSPKTAKDEALRRSTDDSSGRKDLSPEERWGPAEQPGESPITVFVNPAQISEERWTEIFDETRLRLEYAQRGRTFWPRALLVPIERHSPLPELQRFVDLFRPKTVSPNTILDVAGGLDYYLLHHLFGPYLAEGGRGRLAQEGLALLGDRQWSFFEQQIQLARRATTQGGRDSVEAHASGSADAPRSTGDVVQRDALLGAEVEALSKARGISLKKGTMQNMAGNLAALLEIERWRRHEGIEEGAATTSGAPSHAECSVASTDESSGSSGVTAGYDADQSQMPGTTLRATWHSAAGAIPTAPVGHGSGDPCAPSNSAPDRGANLMSRALLRTGDLDKVQSAETGVSANAVPTSAKSVLDEALASRYLNILIHHFGIDYTRRAGVSYADMWKDVRTRAAADAKRVEEICRLDQGISPPPWTASCEPEADKTKTSRDSPAVSDVIPAADQDADDQMPLYALETVLDLLEAQNSAMTALEGMEDVVTGYAVLLDRFRAGDIVALHSHSDAESSSERTPAPLRTTQASKAAHGAAGWNRLFACLERDLAAVLNIFSAPASASIPPSPVCATLEVGELAIKVGALVIACRSISTRFSTEQLRSLCSSILSIIESGKDPISGADADPNLRARRIMALATFALQNEELHREVLEPLEARLVKAADGPMKALVLPIPAGSRPIIDRAMASCEVLRGEAGVEVPAASASSPDEEGNLKVAQAVRGSKKGAPDQVASVRSEGTGDSASASEPDRTHTIRQLVATRNERRRPPAPPPQDPDLSPPQTPQRAPSTPIATSVLDHSRYSQDTIGSSTQPEDSTQEEALFPSLEHLSAATWRQARGTDANKQGPSGTQKRATAAGIVPSEEHQDRGSPSGTAFLHPPRGRRPMTKNLSDSLLKEAPTSSLADPLGRLQRYASPASQLDAVSAPITAGPALNGTETRNKQGTKRTVVALDTPEGRPAVGRVRRA